MKQILRNKDSGNFITRKIKSFFHAISGINYAIRYEHNMIVIIVATIVTVFCGIYFDISLMEWLFCITIIGMITSTELINTAIEATIDLVTFERKPLAKIAKDTAASATLILCIVALIGAIMIFLPKING